MPLVPIQSFDDPHLAPYRAMKEKELARDGKRFIAEGEQLVRRLLASPLQTESVLVAQRKQGLILSLVPENIPVFSASDELIAQVIGFEFHSGVLACGIRPVTPPLAQILPPASQPATLLVCQMITNTENMGAIIRIAAALGACAILLGEHCCDPYFRQSVRVSMGSAFSIPILRSKNLLDDLRELGNAGFFRIASVLDLSAQPLAEFHPPARCAVVVGNEAQGLDESTIRACDLSVTIPMHRGTDSLNVAMATAIFLHHVVSESARL